ncbi:CaiB/BaiF CoA transferase family protein [Leekyejoonella antrihumi]|uniref:CoA transferase n=1 Tax=Leekyejoonella antrihumi TaxID=1660198 RepID=A0A563DWX7_9MICO|nr:CaiB/BaiF CoA-transferase family protein [Leekyejoonella antrihumi]TWP34471.1 CoA transferase [Leekyejoonella antrihumi]
MDLPLDGLRVVSLAHQYPGPFATMLLADLGADVVLVERPPVGDPARAFPGFHSSMARGKRSVALDLKTGSGRQACIALARWADAFLDGYRPGTLDRLGLGQKDLREQNPALIYVSVSGYGQTGPYAHRSGHDLTYQAEAGMLDPRLSPGDPPTAPAVAVGDLAAGLFAAQAVLVGLVQRSRTGHGCVVDVSMFDALVTLLSAHLGPVINKSGPPGFPYEPGYGVFRTSDGKYLSLGVAHEDHFWRALCDAIDMPADRDLAAPQRFEQQERLRDRIGAVLSTRTAAEWATTFQAADVPFGQVRTLAELPQSPQAAARALFSKAPTDDGSTIWHVSQPLRIDGRTPGPRGGVPGMGAHTAEVLTEIGCAPELVEEMAQQAAELQATDQAKADTGGHPAPHGGRTG